MNLDEELRGTLRTHADRAPGGADLLDRVRDRSHRLDVRRRGTAVGAAAILAAVAVAVPVALRSANGDARPPAPAASVVPSPGVDLEAPAYVLPTFPLTPGWTPPGLGAPTAGVFGTIPMLTYGEDVRVTVSPRDYSWDWESTAEHQVEVGGRPARLRTGADENGTAEIGLSWQDRDGRWITVDSGTGKLTEAQIRRYADNLQARTMPATPPLFTLHEAPRGYLITYYDSRTLCLAPPGAPLADKSVTGLCVAVDPPGTTMDGETPEAVTVGGRPGLLAPVYESTGPATPDSTTWELTVPQSDGQVLRVTGSTDPFLPMTRTDILRLAESVTRP